MPYSTCTLATGNVGLLHGQPQQLRPPPQVRIGTHSARALVASKHAKLKGIHLPRTSHARLTLLGGVWVGLLPGVCVGPQSVEKLQLPAHRHATGKTLSDLHRAICQRVRRESSGRFVLRRRRRCPVGLLPACALPGRDEPALALIFT